MVGLRGVCSSRSTRGVWSTGSSRGSCSCSRRCRGGPPMVWRFRGGRSRSPLLVHRLRGGGGAGGPRMEPFLRLSTERRVRGLIHSLPAPGGQLALGRRSSATAASSSSPASPSPLLGSSNPAPAHSHTESPGQNFFSLSHSRLALHSSSRCVGAAKRFVHSPHVALSAKTKKTKGQNEKIPFQKRVRKSVLKVAKGACWSRARSAGWLSPLSASPPLLLPLACKLYAVQLLDRKLQSARLRFLRATN